MNQFYSIAEEGQKPKDEFQLENLGKTRTSPIYTILHGNGHIQHESATRDTISDDYDEAFTRRLKAITPPYEIENFLDFHFAYYMSKSGNQKLFLKHIKTVIIPKMFGREVYIDLINEWLNENQVAKTSKLYIQLPILYDDADLNEIVTHIANNDLQKALNQLLLYYKNDSEAVQEVILQLSRFSQIENDHRQGLRTNEETNTDRTKLAEALLAFIQHHQPNP